MTFLTVVNRSIEMIRKDKIVLAPGLFLSFIVTMGIHRFFPVSSVSGLGDLKTIFPVFFSTLFLEIFFLTFTLLMGKQLMTADRIDFSLLQALFFSTLSRLLGLSCIFLLPFVVMFGWWLYPQTLMLTTASPSIDSLIILVQILSFFVLFSLASVLLNIGEVLVAGQALSLVASIQKAWQLLTMHTRSTLMLVCYSIFLKCILMMMAIGVSGIPVIGESVLSVLIQGFEHTLTAMVLLHFLLIDTEERDAA